MSCAALPPLCLLCGRGSGMVETMLREHPQVSAGAVSMLCCGRPVPGCRHGRPYWTMHCLIDPDKQQDVDLQSPCSVPCYAWVLSFACDPEASLLRWQR